MAQGKTVLENVTNDKLLAIYIKIISGFEKTVKNTQHSSSICWWQVHGSHGVSLTAEVLTAYSLYFSLEHL
jgi:hypothetical protein